MRGDRAMYGVSLDNQETIVGGWKEDVGGFPSILRAEKLVSKLSNFSSSVLYYSPWSLAVFEEHDESHFPFFVGEEF